MIKAQMSESMPNTVIGAVRQGSNFGTCDKSRNHVGRVVTTRAMDCVCSVGPTGGIPVISVMLRVSDAGNVENPGIFNGYVALKWRKTSARSKRSLNQCMVARPRFSLAPWVLVHHLGSRARARSLIVKWPRYWVTWMVSKLSRTTFWFTQIRSNVMTPSCKGYWNV